MRYVRVFFIGQHMDVIYRKDLKEFMKFIKGKKWIEFDTSKEKEMINVDSISYIREIEY